MVVRHDQMTKHIPEKKRVHMILELIAPIAAVMVANIQWTWISWQFAGRLFLSIVFASVKYLIHLCRAVIHAAKGSQLKENIRSVRGLAAIFVIDTEYIPMEFFLLFDIEYKFICILLYLILNIFPWKMIKSKKKSWQAWRWPLGCTGGPLHRLVWGKPRALILQER